MRSIEDKGCLNYGPAAAAAAQEISSSSAINFEFHKGNGGTNRTSHHHRTALGKPTPSKWDDAQKWLVNLSKGGEKSQSRTKPRNSNADDTRLIAPVPNQEEYSIEEEENGCSGSANSTHFEVETKNVDCEESIWRINKSLQSPTSVARSVCVRDMGTEMTPIASQEPSRTATPIRAISPAARSPLSSGSSTPARAQRTVEALESSSSQMGLISLVESRGDSGESESGSGKGDEKKESLEQGNKKISPLEARAMAWDEAERAKYMARYKREQVKIQAWENHEKRRAEMEMRRMEVKAEQLKARAQERLANKLAAIRRIAEEKISNAEAKLNENNVRTSEHADYIRRTGHLPSSFSFAFSFKLPSCSCCW